MKKQYLLFDSGCSLCTSLACQVEEVSDGKLIARSLRDPEIRPILDAENPGWSWEPMLLEMDDEGRQLYTGVGMRLHLARVLGPRRALDVARIVQKATAFQPARRGVLKLAGGLMASLALGGWASKSVRAKDTKPSVSETGQTGSFKTYLPEISNSAVGGGPSISPEEQAIILDLVGSTSMYQENKRDLSFADVVKIPDQTDWVMVVQANVAQGANIPEHMLFSFVNHHTKVVKDQVLLQIDNTSSKRAIGSATIVARSKSKAGTFIVKDGRITTQDIRYSSVDPEDAGGVACGLVCGSIPLVYCWVTAEFVWVCSAVFTVICAFICG